MDEKHKKQLAPGKRKKIGLIDTEPKRSDVKPDGLTPRQQALREAVINNFKANKVRSYIAKQINYVNSSRQVAEGISFLFDEHGQPPANAPLADIIAERKNIESQIRWFEAMSSELQNKLTKIKEIEELALEYIDQERDDGK
ncbi:MAG: hypothetical protein ABW098_01220 [Candidatus Thiodiazotropha sp.]